MTFLSRELASDSSLGCALEVRCQMSNEYARELGHGCSRIWQSAVTADSCIALVTLCTRAERNTSPLVSVGGWNSPLMKTEKSKSQSIWAGGEEVGQILTYLNKHPIYRLLIGCKLEQAAQERTKWPEMRAQRGRMALRDTQWSHSVLKTPSLKEKWEHMNRSGIQSTN